MQKQKRQSKLSILWMLTLALVGALALVGGRGDARQLPLSGL